jgi:dihydropteroate synthase
MHWQTTRHLIDLTTPRVMGVVNLTPDSFSDGGRHASVSAGIRHCERLVAQGADILDLGAESTRPGSPPVPLEEERARLLPVLREALALGVPVSVDTYKADLMREVLDLGADIINDIWVTENLLARGVARARIAWDPGVGFGKTPAQNFDLLARQSALLADGWPLLVGWSRKSSLGAVTGLPVSQRLVPSVAAALLAVERGARIVRVHDVAETVAALKVWAAARPPA